MTRTPREIAEEVLHECGFSYRDQPAVLVSYIESLSKALIAYGKAAREEERESVIEELETVRFDPADSREAPINQVIDECQSVIRARGEREEP